MSSIGIFGIDSQLCEFFIERLLQSGKKIMVEGHQVHSLRQKFADILCFGNGSINPLLLTETEKLKHLICFSNTGEFVPGTTILIHPSSVECPTNKITRIVIHDLLLSSIDEFSRRSRAMMVFSLSV